LESVLSDASPHVVTPEPDGAAAPERCVAGSEDDLFVGAHAQHFVRLDH